MSDYPADEHPRPSDDADPADRETGAPDPDGLPTAARDRIVAWAAASLDVLGPERVPAPLRRVALFTPAKRARRGAAVLLAVWRGDPAFRAAVAESVPTESTTDNLATRAARAYLLGAPNAAELLGELHRGQHSAPGSASAMRRRSGDRRPEATSTDAPGREVEQGVATVEQVDRFRRRLREQGQRVRAAEDAAADAIRALESERARAAADLEGARAAEVAARERADAAVRRADRAELRLAAVQQRSPRTRAAGDRRLNLLLATVESAAAGLRREWDLQGGGPDPADTVTADWPAPVLASEPGADRVRLQAWLTLPHVHLVVDGYNVTKTGYPELTLEQQRDRLARGLAALTARVSVEATVIFDGADVIAARPLVRGVRVLFSPPGIVADEVIVDVVAAEPHGRVVVVITSDRELTSRVRRRGARTATSAVLLQLLGGRDD